ncbi:heterokaryon incompatibility protein-domain-containing protein [Xylariales sp. PMI_506]|nr:heterokaryon incompatibility protein-domain-containing protein [Xylariales sp. PMI_506]
MRLINTRTLQFHHVTDANQEQYAILSHTWGDEEVTFQDMALTNSHLKAGYHKIKETCRLALAMNFNYAWVDTCCIDKSSSAELTESINSMYQWYRSASVCFVHLADLEPDQDFRSSIGKCRWVRRGWTLQELIAPSKALFYDKEWNFRGDKDGYSEELSEATRIPIEVLLKQEMAPYSVAQRMSWASQRQTTRVEDTAYCLLGILGVNMPMIYGEGSMAFRRLQEEIIKHSNDLTVFAWNPLEVDLETQHCDLLAPSPAVFSRGAAVVPWQIYHYNPEYVLTNKGLRIEDYLYYIYDQVSGGQEPKFSYVLLVGVLERDDGKAVGVRLTKVGPGLFLRQLRDCVILSSEARAACATTPTSTFYLMATPKPPSHATLARFRSGGVLIPYADSIRHAVPDMLWDRTECFFSRDYTDLIRAVKLEVPVEAKSVTVGVLCDRSTGQWQCRLLDVKKHENIIHFIFQERSKAGAVKWRDLRLECPEVDDLDTQADVAIGAEKYCIRAEFVDDVMESFGIEVPVKRLLLTIDKDVGAIRK